MTNRYFSDRRTVCDVPGLKRKHSQAHISTAQTRSLSVYLVTNQLRAEVPLVPAPPPPLVPLKPGRDIPHVF